MGDNKWSHARRQKANERKQMQAYYEKEYLLDDEEKDKNGKNKR